MKYLSVGIAVAAVAAAWAWRMHGRRHANQALAPRMHRADSPAAAGIDDGILRRPPNPDPNMVRTPPNPDPNMVLDPEKRRGEQRSAANNGRKRDA